MMTKDDANAIMFAYRYEIFELENGVPTYGYELAQAVKDGYLVDFLSVETKLKFIEQGIVYDELSDEEKQIYEDTFEDENGELPERIASSALNEWIFNEDTIRQVLNTLMTHGLTIDYGNKLGKTIIFAENPRGFQSGIPTSSRLCQGHRQLYDLCAKRHRRIF